MNLYRIKVLVWTKNDQFEALPHKPVYDATLGDDRLSGKHTVSVEDPQDDPEFDGAEFFGIDEEENLT